VGNRNLRSLEYINSIKSGPCVDCDNHFPLNVMDFDHVRGEKLFLLCRGIYKSLDSVIEEIKKCDLVCANCHRVRTQSRLPKFIIPHITLPPIVSIEGVHDSKKFYELNKNRAILRNKIKLFNIRKFLQDQKENKSCTDCGKSFPYFVLDWDHDIIKPKCCNISTIYRKGWSKKRILDEIGKCDLVCANCHRIRTSTVKSKGRVFDHEPKERFCASKQLVITCTKCGSPKERGNYEGGLICKDCIRKRSKNRQTEKRDMISIQKRDYRQRNKEFVKSYRCGTCSDCGEFGDRLNFSPIGRPIVKDMSIVNTWSHDRIIELLKSYKLVCNSCLGKKRCRDQQIFI
jgi:hypothetical protein